MQDLTENVHSTRCYRIEAEIITSLLLGRESYNSGAEPQPCAPENGAYIAWKNYKDRKNDMFEVGVSWSFYRAGSGRSNHTFGQLPPTTPRLEIKSPCIKADFLRIEPTQQ